MGEGLIIIGGGTGEARTIDREYQSFLKLDGRTCLEIVLDEATKTDNSYPIFLWGPEARLRETLSPILKREENRREIHIVPEKFSPIDSLIFTCLESSRRTGKDSKSIRSPLEHVMPSRSTAQRAVAAQNEPRNYIFYLSSDIPLVCHEEIDFFIKNADRDYDLLMGWSLRGGLETALKSFQNDQGNIDTSTTKINFSRFIVDSQPVEARFNNLYCGRPLRIDPHLYIFFHQIYKNRNLIKQTYRRGKMRKKIDRPDFLRLMKAFVRYVQTRKREGGTRVVAYGYRILNTHLHSLGLEGKNYRYLSALTRLLRGIEKKSPSFYLDKNIIEENILKLTGNKIGMYLSNLIGPLLDIDGKNEYEFVKANFRRLRDGIDKYYTTCGMRKLP